MEDEDYETLEPLCADYNVSRMEAFKQILLTGDNYTAHQISEMSKTLVVFFRFVDQVMNRGLFLYEDIQNIHSSFEPIMHKFIFKHGDIDDEIFDEVYISLITFYGLLSQYKIVNRDDYKDFVKEINGRKSKLRQKMHRYNEIRHDYNMGEEEKEAIREELFKGDHAWPFI